MKKSKHPKKKVSISQSMDDVTKDKIVLVDVNGNTLGEYEKKPKKPETVSPKIEEEKPKRPEPKPVSPKSEDKKYGNDKIQTVKIPRKEEEPKPNHVMRRRMTAKERRRNRRKAIAAFVIEVVLGLAILVIGSGLFVFFFCKMENVTVEGSTIYSEEEIKGFILDGKYSSNCVYNVIHNIFHPKKDIAFIQDAKVGMQGLNTVKITITERIPIAYIASPLAEAVDVNAIEAEPTGNEAEQNAEQSQETVSVEEAPVDTVQEPEEGATDTDGTVEKSQDTATSISANRSDTVIRYFDEDGKITDVSDIRLPNSTEWTGILATGEKAGDVIVDDGVKLDSILTTLKALKANNVLLDSVSIDDKHNIFGRIGEIKINFGLKNDMDSKCKRLSVILTQLQNQPGTLHLENYTPENTDIVFKKEF